MKKTDKKKPMPFGKKGAPVPFKKGGKAGKC